MWPPPALATTSSASREYLSSLPDTTRVGRGAEGRARGDGGQQVVGVEFERKAGHGLQQGDAGAGPAPGQCRPEGLEGVADLAGHFALAEVELAVVLVKDHDAAHRFALLRQEQKGGDHIVLQPAVLDALAGVAVEVEGLGALDIDRDGLSEAEALAESGAEIGHRV